ncbi:MAG: hypothetical protein ACK56I_30290, partial [bacterium]
MTPGWRTPASQLVRYDPLANALLPHPVPLLQLSSSETINTATVESSRSQGWVRHDPERAFTACKMPRSVELPLVPARTASEKDCAALVSPLRIKRRKQPAAGSVVTTPICQSADSTELSSGASFPDRLA